MYRAGVPPRYMRICEPFGPEQRQGLWLYHVVEPERWAAMCARVSGARSGGIYAGTTTTSTVTERSSSPTTSAGKSTPCCSSTACRNRRLNIIAIKSRCTCTGIRSAGCPIFPIRRRVISAQRISRLAANMQGSAQQRLLVSGPLL